MTAASGLRMYNKAQARDSQHQLIERYAPLVKRIAYHLLARLPASVQVDDLIQAGMIGLLEASRKYDAGKGASFETFAGIRIRGAMLDEVRKGDWAPRSVHRNSRMVSDAIRAVEIAARPEVHQHDASTVLPHHVLRFDVAVNESFAVNFGKGAADIDPDERRLLCAERSVFREMLLERRAAD